MCKCVTLNAFTHSHIWGEMPHAGLGAATSNHEALKVTKLPKTTHRARRGGRSGRSGRSGDPENEINEIYEINALKTK